MTVFDASVALSWFLNEPLAAAAESAFTTAAQPPIAPELVLAEIGNGLWSAVRGKRIERSAAVALFATVPALYSNVAPLAPLAPRAFAISGELDHPVYDCFYLALAETQRSTLLTTDTRLQRKVAGTPWAGVVVGLAP